MSRVVASRWLTNTSRASLFDNSCRAWFIKIIEGTGETLDNVSIHNAVARQLIKGWTPVFSIKNVSILNGHNFGPERRTEIEKKAI